ILFYALMNCYLSFFVGFFTISVNCGFISYRPFRAARFGGGLLPAPLGRVIILLPFQGDFILCVNGHLFRYKK
ncbi:MAG: hypothetical protein LBE18_01590, partial [Planctomycetaceae bacterium]|nr:hypothetical protein [Planctomycetaceae bacterium]